MTQTVPPRALQQRRDALAAANQVRVRRARLKMEVKAGRVPVWDVLLNPPSCVRSMSVMELLLAAPKVGRVRALRALRAADISPAGRLGDLSRPRRRRLAEVLQRNGGWSS